MSRLSTKQNQFYAYIKVHLMTHKGPGRADKNKKSSSSSINSFFVSWSLSKPTTHANKWNFIKNHFADHSSWTLLLLGKQISSRRSWHNWFCCFSTLFQLVQSTFCGQCDAVFVLRFLANQITVQSFWIEFKLSDRDRNHCIIICRFTFCFLRLRI